MEQLFQNQNECCGCLACVHICPMKAIDIVTEVDGFDYPKINSKQCTNCNRCEEVCPMKKNSLNIKNENLIQALAYKTNDNATLKKSSSGGAFTKISDNIFNRSGYVSGAVFDENLTIKHIVECKEEFRNSMRGAKYVQSRVEIYQEIKELILDDKYVLFTGTPCQVLAMKNYLKDICTDKLYTADLICHGVGSPQIFEDYKEDLNKKYSCKVKEISFRYKNEDGFQNMYIKFENNTEKVISCTEDIYFNLFHRDIILRPSCYTCPFSNLYRVGDVTLGDFWSINKVFPEFDKTREGSSLVLLNSEKGRSLFYENNYDLIQVCDNNLFMQQALKYPTSNPIKNNSFWDDYNKGGFRFIVNKYVTFSKTQRIKHFTKRFFKKMGLWKTLKRYVN